MRSRLRSVFVLILLLAAAAVQGQDLVLDPVEKRESTRPEAWGMKFFTATTLMTPVVDPGDLEPWSVAASVELTTIPHLSAEKRRLGFEGHKEEDLNKLPAFGRPRLSIGLPADMVLSLGWIPPVEVGGVRSNLVTGSLARRWRRAGGGSFLVGVIGQKGTVKSSFTCWEELLESPPGSPENPFGCSALSEDVAKLDSWGMETEVTHPVALLRGSRLHAGVSVAWMDAEFQVHARRFGFLDRTLFLAEEWVAAGRIGLSWPVAGRGTVGVETFYAPLLVKRPGEDVHNDPLLNFRLVASWRLR